jgi:hypothetical protein
MISDDSVFCMASPVELAFVLPFAPAADVEPAALAVEGEIPPVDLALAAVAIAAALNEATAAPDWAESAEAGDCDAVAAALGACGGEAIY